MNFNNRIKLAIIKYEFDNIQEGLSDKARKVLQLIKSIIILNRKKLLKLAENGGILETKISMVLLCEATNDTRISTDRIGNNHRLIKISGMNARSGQPVVLYAVVPLRDNSGATLQDANILNIINNNKKQYANFMQNGNRDAAESIRQGFYKSHDAAIAELQRRDGSQPVETNIKSLNEPQATQPLQDNQVAKAAPKSSHLASKLRSITGENIHGMPNGSAYIDVIKSINDEELVKGFNSFVWSDAHLTGMKTKTTSNEYMGSVVEFASQFAIPLLMVSDINNVREINKKLARLMITYMLYRIAIVETNKLNLKAQQQKDAMKQTKDLQAIEAKKADMVRKNRELALKEKDLEIKAKDKDMKNKVAIAKLGKEYSV